MPRLNLAGRGLPRTKKGDKILLIDRGKGFDAFKVPPKKTTKKRRK